MLAQIEKTKLINQFRRLDASVLARLVDNKVVKIVNQSMPNLSERTLAEVLIERYDNQLFDSKKIRRAYIDSLDAGTVQAATKVLKLGNVQDEWDALTNYFSNWTKKNSKEFCDAFQLSDKFVKESKSETIASVDKVEQVYGEELKSKGQLHPYQRSIKDQISVQLALKDKREVVVQMPTGAGKTFTMLESLVDLLRSQKSPNFIVWVVNSNELARQSMKSFVDLWRQKGDRTISVYKFFDALKPKGLQGKTGIVFASFSTLNAVIKQKGSAAENVLSMIAKDTHTLVVDEAHSSPAETYADCLDYFDDHGLEKLVGLTATPGRGSNTETKELIQRYQRNIIQIKDPDGNSIDNVVGYLQEQEYLAKLKTDFLETSSTVEASDERLICSELAQDGDRNEKILDKIQEYVEQKKSTLVFACTLAHVFSLYVLCKQRSIRSEFIVGETPNSKRQKILDRFTKKENLVLINLDILETGVDIPTLDHVFITRPVGSGVSYSQIIGRALRGPKNGGKKQNDITTLVDNLDLHLNEQVMFKSYWESWGI